MLAVIGLLIVLLMALCVTRIASEALVLTGLTRSVARFQARSAYTGAGFTTSEAEVITSDPMRRKIIMWLMLLGHIGFVTVIGSAMLSLTSKHGIDGWKHWVVLCCGIVFLLWLTFSKWVQKTMGRMISWALKKFAKIQVQDYKHLLHIGQEYGISAVHIPSGSWLGGMKVNGVFKYERQVVLLGIETPDGQYNGAPKSTTTFTTSDVLMLYGPTSKIAEFRNSIDLPEKPERPDSKANAHQ
ncbi:MAG: potassium transporter TrkA [Phycisphaerae bacterium]|nr:potassium transporter TrkA [Phycisphaerae bacterium]